MEIYEYLFSAIVIILMLVASSTMIVSMPQPILSTSNKEQLKIAAQKIMTQLILDPGNPPDWGSNLSINPDELVTFGLAKYGESTREAYVLDPDKVQRLSSISPDRILNLLNLGTDYGIKLEFIPVINVTIMENQQENSYSFSVTSYQTNLPIFNAKITAGVFYYNEAIQQIESELRSVKTDENGQGLIIFSDTPSSADKILIAVVDYCGMTITKLHVQGTKFSQATTIGEHIILNQEISIKNNIAYNVIINKDVPAETYTIKPVPSKVIQENATVYKLETVEPNTIAVLSILEDNSLLLASKNVNYSYSSIPEIASIPFAYTMERTVMIGDSLYTMRMQIWRMSW